MIAVSAAILVRGGRVMLCQRPENARLALKWEFPGGKLEEGETPEQALERELREELDISTRTGRIYDARVSGGNLILFYFTELLHGEPRCVDCRDIAWLRPEELTDMDLAPADAAVAARLAAELPGTP